MKLRTTRSCSRGLLLAVTSEMAQATAFGAEQRRVWEDHRLPITSGTDANPHPVGELFGDVHQDAHPRRMRSGEAERIPVDLQSRPNASSYGENGSFVVEVNRKARKLHPDRDERRVLLRREVQRPLEEPERTAVHQHGLLEKDFQVVLPVGETEEEVPTVHCAEQEVLLEEELLGEMRLDVDERRPAFRGSCDDGEGERAAHQLNFFEREECRGLAGVGRGRCVDGEW